MAAHAEEFHIFKLGLIWLFSGALIYVGAKELHKRHAAHAERSVTDPAQLISELQGEVDVVRLVKDPEFLKEEVQKRNQVQAQRRESLKAQFKKLLP